MADNDKLALLIPAYNAAGHLPRLLSSAAAQTVPFDEIWVYDDCSTDDTAAVAGHYGARVVKGDVNRGCSHGKNALAAKTDCAWLHFHDADDDLKPGFVALARKWMHDGRYDVVIFAYDEVDDATERQIAVCTHDHDDISRDARSYAIRRQINAINGLYRRAPFLDAGGYDLDPRVLYNEDVALHVRLAFAGLAFAAEPEVAIVNRRRMNSMSSANQVKCLQAHYNVMRKIAEREDATPYVREIAVRLWHVVGGATAHLDWVTADAAASLAMRLAGPSVAPTSSLFRTLCRVSPHAALRLREALVRLAKPQHRKGYPGWRLGARGQR